MASGHPDTNGFRLDKVTLITGGSRGIGAGCARVFCRAGAKVLICARGREAGETLAAELTSKGPGECRFEPFDAGNAADVERVVEKTVSLYGRLDCLLNNAGFHPPHRPIDQFSVEDFDTVLRVDLVSYFAACKAALPHLRRVRGSIINMSSLVGVMGQQFATTYCAAKAGIIGLTKALAIEEARHGVRVNTVLPGNINSDSRLQAVRASQDPKLYDNLIDSWQWPGRSGDIEEVGYACLFLASDWASYITGIELTISAGSELGYGIKAPWKLGIGLPPEQFPGPVNPL